jgi:two-component system, NtrC family, response regulator AtoC
MVRKELSNSSKKALLQYAFPGNVRELKAMMETSAVLSDSTIIHPEDIPFSEEGTNEIIYQPGYTLEDYTLKIIQNILQANKNNVIQTAKKLDIGKSTIYRFIKEGKIHI